MAKVIFIGNQKGGVGKTTTAATLASGLAKVNLKTLLIDLDVQSHIAMSFGLEKNNAFTRWIVPDNNGNTVPFEQSITKVRENLDVIIGGKDTIDVDIFLNKQGFTREKYLKNKLSALPYDVIVMDSAPNFSVLQLNALVAADCLIVPTRLGNLDTDGLAEIVKTMTSVSDEGFPVELFGILPTFFDRTTKETLEQLKIITKTYGQSVWPPIPQDTHVREAQAFGQTLWEYCPNSPAVTGFEQNGTHIGGYIDLLKRIVEYVKHG